MDKTIQDQMASGEVEMVQFNFDMTVRTYQAVRWFLVQKQPVDVERFKRAESETLTDIAEMAAFLAKSKK